MRYRLVRIAALVAVGGLGACQGQDDHRAAFGGLDAMDQSLKGEIYRLPPGAARLPDFRLLRPIGAVYVRELNVTDQEWRAGFPGLTGLQWFAIDYRGQVQVAEAGRYAFTLSSADGSRLLIDGRVVVDNDGIHDAAAATGQAQLSAGPHAVEVRYFQGPRDKVALRLTCQRPGQAAPAVFPRCGMAIKTPGVSIVWLSWLALLAAVGAVAVSLVVRRVALESRHPPVAAPPA